MGLISIIKATQQNMSDAKEQGRYKAGYEFVLGGLERDAPLWEDGAEARERTVNELKGRIRDIETKAKTYGILQNLAFRMGYAPFFERSRQERS